MESNNKDSRNYSGCWILYTLIGSGAWIALIIAKACGAIPMNWPAVILGIFWVPAIILAFALGLVGVLALLKTARRRLREWKRRRKIARTVWEAMEGLTLNQIGLIYGVKRQQDEKNRDYKRRILKAARTVDTVNVQNLPKAARTVNIAKVQNPPKPATGAKLDAIAKRNGLKRYRRETDEHLQNRIRMATLAKLEGGGKNG